MKYIFDFDDVLFFNTLKFKPHMYHCLEEAGIPKNISEVFYKKIRVSRFWLKDLIKHFSLNNNFYEKILKDIDIFLNIELINQIKKLGKENCFILTHGGEEFQLDKINKTGISSLFSEIVVVFDKKTEAIEKICLKYKDEEVLFIDDKQEHFDNLDMKKYPNLKTILYKGQDLKSVLLP